MMDPGERHVGNGLTVRRMPGGSVLVRLYLDGGEFRRVHWSTEVSARDWSRMVSELAFDLVDRLKEGADPA